MKQNSASGGHAFLRFVADLLQSNSLTRILSASNSQLIVDVGAKFGSIYKILKAATRIHGHSLKTTIDDAIYRLAYIRKNLDLIFNGDEYTDFY